MTQGSTLFRSVPVGPWQWTRALLLECDFLLALTWLGLTGVATLYFGRADETNPRPFFLADASLWYEWKYKRDTVPIWSVFVTAYLVVLPIIGVGEYRLATRSRDVPSRPAILTALRFAIGVCASSMLAVVFVECGKTYVGRLRPNFAHRCLGAGAVPPSTTEGLLSVISSDAACTGHSSGPWDGRRSFPSGHAALAVSVGVYTQLWLFRARAGLSDGGAVGAYGLGVAALFAGLWVAATRIVDGAHHVSDVAVGGALGAWTGASHFWVVAHETEVAERSRTRGYERRE
jgi:membrane-associated phospholipid phosphatase